MVFKALPKSSKIRSVVFLVMTVLLAVSAVSSCEAYYGLQQDLVTVDPQNASADGADFSLFFIAGVGLLNTVTVLIMMVSLTAVLLIGSVIAAVLMRTIGLRKTASVPVDEYTVCSRLHLGIFVLGLIVSLVITKGGVVVPVAVFSLLPMLAVRLIYLTALKKRTITHGNGHFIPGTQQDLKELLP